MGFFFTTPLSQSPENSSVKIFFIQLYSQPSESRLVKIFVQDKARRRRRIYYSPRRRNAVLREKIYQDAFLTPGIWPL